MQNEPDFGIGLHREKPERGVVGPFHFRRPAGLGNHGAPVKFLLVGPFQREAVALQHGGIQRRGLPEALRGVVENIDVPG